jgi:hypothetical protein
MLDKSFLSHREHFMSIGFNRRVATLAARLILGVDTFNTIAQCPSFCGNPLLSESEKKLIESNLTS